MLLAIFQENVNGAMLTEDKRPPWNILKNIQVYEKFARPAFGSCDRTKRRMWGISRAAESKMSQCNTGKAHYLAGNMISCVTVTETAGKQSRF